MLEKEGFGRIHFSSFRTTKQNVKLQYVYLKYLCVFYFFTPINIRVCKPRIKQLLFLRAPTIKKTSFDAYVLQQYRYWGYINYQKLPFIDIYFMMLIILDFFCFCKFLRKVSYHVTSSFFE